MYKVYEYDFKRAFIVSQEMEHHNNFADRGHYMI